MALKRTYDDVKQNSDVLEELVHQMKHMPDETAQLMLKRLRTGADLKLVLRSIKNDAVPPATHLSEQTTARAILPSVHSEREMELMVRHPNAYPLLHPLGSEPRSFSPLLSPTADWQASQMQHSNILHAMHRSLSPLSISPSAIMTSAGTDTDIEAMDTSESRSSFGPDLSPDYCDPRLARLQIRFWTSVPIANEYAASVISLYLETNHPILGLFDADLFINDLVDCKFGYCSAFLVSSLLAFASQSYAQKEPEAFAKSYQFEQEAQELWHAERFSDTPNTIAALALLFQSLGGHGKSDVSSQVGKAMSAMASRMKLFNTEDEPSMEDFFALSTPQRSSAAYAAWGAFNTLTMGALFRIVPAVGQPPALPIPGRPPKESGASASWLDRTPHPKGTGQTFGYFCSFWAIVSQILFMSNGSQENESVSLAFVLSRYHQLLSLADSLSGSMVRKSASPAHVLVFQRSIWYHAAILHIFRPYISDDNQHGFTHWLPAADSPHAIFAASLSQLKQLALVFRSQHETAAYTIFWHIVLMFVANAALRDLSDEDWHFYFLVCIRGYSKLSASFQFAEGTAQGLLAMAVQRRAISSKEAAVLMADVHDTGSCYRLSEQTTTGFTLDLDLALTDRKAAMVESLVDEFDQLTVFNEFTTGIV
ncbi:MAG: hypothetical protein M1822_007692 [Bathelium mastoideum]|nr:MAG: hypothetical protein M1822_007692 [Bathelium mastoideum]